MNSYKLLWEYIKIQNKESLKLSFGEIKNILGFDINHTFLKCKKDLKSYGYEVKKISLKEKYILFSKL